MAKDAAAEAEKIAAEEAAKGAVEDAAEGPTGEAGKAATEEAGKAAAEEVALDDLPSSSVVWQVLEGERRPLRPPPRGVKPGARRKGSF